MQALLHTLLAFSIAPVAPQGGESSTPAHGRVTFEFTHPTQPDERLFVLGDHAVLGGDDVRRAVPMSSPNRLDWRVTISLPPRQDYRYAFYVRADDVGRLGMRSNGTQVSEPFTGSTSAGPDAAARRAVEVLTDLVDPVLRWRVGASGAFHARPMREVGPGRSAGEARWAAQVGAPRGDLEFFLEDALGGREPVSGRRRTALAEVFVQDGELFSYRPAEEVSPPRRVQPRVMQIDSAVLGETRDFRVMLPRGYAEHEQRRYPVLYQYDGQVAWDGPMSMDRGGRRLERLVADGEVGELIVVAVDAPVGCGRARDTMPADDSLRNVGCNGRGRAQDFLTFVVTELKPTVDSTWRTWPERETTFLSGYSLGGLLAWVASHDFGADFGAVAAQSPSLWAAPQFERRVRGIVPVPRVELDFGDLEPLISPDGWELTQRLTRAGATVGEDLHVFVGFGQMHSFPEGGQRLGPVLRALWPATAEQAELHARAHAGRNAGRSR